MFPLEHFSYLDGWRGLAIFFLLLGHFFPVPGINFGAAGVGLFFVLSGFLMARLLFVRQVPIPQFYKRRIARIFPAVLVFIAVMVGVQIALAQRVTWSEVLAAAAFVNNYLVGILGKEAMPFGHFWSLCVEEHSYIALSIIAIAARRRLASARAMLFIATVIIAGCTMVYTANYGAQDLFRLAMHSEVAAFGIFASATLLLCAQGHTWPRLPAAAYFVLIGGGLALYWWQVPPVARLLGGAAVFALTVNLLSNAPPSLHALMSARPLRQLGLWSFSIYVWQQPFYLLSKHHGLHPLLGLALAIGSGIASFYLLEHPVRRWLNRHWSPNPVAAPAVYVEAA